jgi:hypothetical protein
MRSQSGSDMVHIAKRGRRKKVFIILRELRYLRDGDQAAKLHERGSPGEFGIFIRRQVHCRFLLTLGGRNR